MLLLNLIHYLRNQHIFINILGIWSWLISFNFQTDLLLKFSKTPHISFNYWFITIDYIHIFNIILI